MNEDAMVWRVVAMVREIEVQELKGIVARMWGLVGRVRGEVQRGRVAEWGEIEREYEEGFVKNVLHRDRLK